MTASIFDRGAGVYEAKLRGFLVSVELVVLLRCLRIISSSGTLTVCPNKPCTTPSRPCPNRSAFAPVEIFTGLPGLINGSVTYCELDSDATLPPTDDEEETFCLLIGLNRSATVLFDFREPRRLRRTYPYFPSFLPLLPVIDAVMQNRPNHRMSSRLLMGVTR